jgi:multimeric flavodoxin WrbA
MKIIVLNGSPKGEVSVTLQYVNYLAKKYPQHEFKTLHIAQRIKRIESDPQTFADIIEQVRSADGVLWAFPLYILLIHAHYKRFIELLFERGATAAFSGKYAATLSTSIHYFDHTAHNYMRGICDDLGMRFVSMHSAEMYDLEKESGQEQLLQFGKHFFNTIQSQAPTQRLYAPIHAQPFSYAPTAPVGKTIPTNGKKVVIVHDSQSPDSNLNKMVDRTRTALDGYVNVINLNAIDMKASCQGCLQCGSNYECAYEGKDGFIEFYRSTVMDADVVIFAGTIKDRYLSSRWKMLFDRAFFNTHTPVLGGKQMAYLISGPFSQIPNLQEVLQGYAEFQASNLVGFISDEVNSSTELDQLIDQLVSNCMAFSQSGYTAPMTFLGVGGMKVFRDDVWSKLRFVFQADHKAYQRLGIYQTFPQNDVRSNLMNTFVTPIFKVKRLRQEFDKRIKPNMIITLKQVVEKA